MRLFSLYGKMGAVWQHSFAAAKLCYRIAHFAVRSLRLSLSHICILLTSGIIAASCSRFFFHVLLVDLRPPSHPTSLWQHSLVSQSPDSSQVGLLTDGTTSTVVVIIESVPVL